MKQSNVPTLYERYYGLLVAGGTNPVPTKTLVQALVDVHKAEVSELLEKVEHFLQDSAVIDDLKARYLV